MRSFAENGATPVASLSVTAQNRKTIAAAGVLFGGADAAEFRAEVDDAGSGLYIVRVFFQTPPDFETPTDAGADNQYDITLVISDSAGEESAAYPLVVAVTDIAAPTIALVGSPPTTLVYGKDYTAASVNVNDALSTSDNLVTVITGPDGSVVAAVNNTVPGDYLFTYTATVSSETATLTHTVTVYADSTLSVLAVSPDTLSLAPAFDPEVTFYIIDVATEVTSVTLTATANDGNAGVAATVEKGEVPPAVAIDLAQPIDLAIGGNAVSIRVTATDGRVKRYLINVIRAPVVHEANTAPEITGSGVVNFSETTSDLLVATYTVTDDQGDAVEWQLGSSDSGFVAKDFFTITGGELRFKTQPDYEYVAGGYDPTTYNLTVGASETDTTEKLSSNELEVRIDLLNVEEVGSIGPITGTLKVGQTLTAASPVTDPDAVTRNNLTGEIPVADITYQWASRVPGDVRTIAGATDSTYQLTHAEAGRTIRVTAKYDDPQGRGKSIASEATTQVVAASANNDLATLTLVDNDGANVALNQAVASATLAYTATVPGDTTAVTVTATATDSTAEVDVDRSGTNSEQIGFDTTRSTYTLRIKIVAEDTTEKEYTLHITRAKVTVNGDAALSVNENNPDLEVVTYTATAAGDDRSIASYALGGEDADDFMLDTSTGLLSFSVTPNYEAPADANTDNDYEITITATDNADEQSEPLTVTITVTNVDEPGAIGDISGTAQVGVELTAGTVTDLDSPADGTPVTVTGHEWQSAVESTDATAAVDDSAWPPISGATGATYEPVVGDVDKIIRVVATYTDGEGGGKEVASAATGAVQAAAPINQPPTAGYGFSDPLAIQAGRVANLLGTGADPEDATLAMLAWSQADCGAVVVGAAGCPAVTLTNTQVGNAVTAQFMAPDTAVTLNFILTATDSGGLTGTAPATIKVTNARLSSVVFMPEVTLEPLFSSVTDTYTITVASTVAGITVMPIARDATAGITVNKLAAAESDVLIDTQTVVSGATSRLIELTPGANTITLVTTTGDGATETYRFTIIRIVVRSDNANLGSVTLADNDGTVFNLNEAITPEVTDYTATVPFAATSFTLTVTPDDSGARADIDDDGSATKTIDFSRDTADVEVYITPEVGSPDKYYTITFARASAAVAALALTTVDNQNYTVGTPITDLTLPEAIGGTGALSYTLTGPGDTALPDGLTFTADTRTLSGAPSTAAPTTELTYTVTDSAPTPVSTTQTFMVTVNAAADTTAPVITFNRFEHTDGIVVDTTTYLNVGDTLTVFVGSTELLADASLTDAAVFDIDGDQPAQNLVRVGATNQYSATYTVTSTDNDTTPAFKVSGVTDTADTPNTAGDFTTELGTVIIDTSAPTIDFPNLGEPTVGQPANVKITFSEAVADFASADITGATAVADSGDHTTYLVTYTPSAPGTVTLTLAANAVSDLAGNTAPATDKTASGTAQAAATETAAKPRITATITLPGLTTAEFDRGDFVTGMANFLSVEAANVHILSVTAGSVIVDYEIVADTAAELNAPAMTLSDADAAQLRTASGQSIPDTSAVSTTVARQEATEPPTQGDFALTAGEITATSITFTWEAVEGANQYRVFVDDSTRYETSNSPSHTAIRLTSDTPYTFRVEAKSVTGRPSNLQITDIATSTALTLTTASTPAPAITGLVVEVEARPEMTTLTWDAYMVDAGVGDGTTTPYSGAYTIESAITVQTPLGPGEEFNPAAFSFTVNQTTGAGATTHTWAANPLVKIYRISIDDPDNPGTTLYSNLVEGAELFSVTRDGSTQPQIAKFNYDVAATGATTLDFQYLPPGG